ncbi:uncharacterized protein MKZ38_008197 [Zalerion maritima]|uniref:Fumarylacetoacetase-like C-terminal domain-containing protein n=1 Tax=Zalerion maritima TaxID=339359 RepID=A0AAD5RI89_9PEZI|nr:uncharacterized protein MKZ38_008197 [Zalerion maritima]
MAFERLVRFIPSSDEGAILIGQPVDSAVDVGAAVRKGEDVKVKVFSGSSALSPGSLTDKVESIGRILSPVSMSETLPRGARYKEHAKEANISLPDVPTVFMKPATCLADPWPATTPIPKHTLADDSADYESELCVVIGKTAKNVSEADALDYVLGYTACNDISSRKEQFATSQWSYSKSFDKACPIGPVLASKELVGDVGELHMKGFLNGKGMQDSKLNDMIFNVPKLVSFLAKGSTLPAGTIIITGTPAGVGIMRKPKVVLHDGDEFVVEIQPHIGSLYNVMEAET